MTPIHFGHVEALLNVSGVHGAAFFSGDSLVWSRIPAFPEQEVIAIGRDLRDLKIIYREVGREIRELYFCFHRSAWLGVLRGENLLLVHLDEQVSLDRVVAGASRFFGAKTSKSGV